MQLPDSSPNYQGKILDHGAGIGEASRDGIEHRARELAEIDGLDPDQVNDGHRFQARREMLGAADADMANDADGLVANLVHEDDVPGESGSSSISALNPDEPTIGEELYSEGVTEADHDRMTQSRRQERLEK